ncbi:MAG: hypothetical protein F4Y33_11290, partial [Gemmatimonadales bacterium]|nr:hypothetical protein [Gemmatimonadales bacterium]
MYGRCPVRRRSGRRKPSPRPSAGSPMSDVVRIAVLASGGGSNFQALVDRFQRADVPDREVVGVIASREGAGVLERARRA